MKPTSSPWRSPASLTVEISEIFSFLVAATHGKTMAVHDQWNLNLHVSN